MNLIFYSGVTIVKVGGNSYGSKGELSYKSGSRHEISSSTTSTAPPTNTQWYFLYKFLSKLLNLIF